MIQSARFQTSCKALLLVGMGLFLYSRLLTGTLYFYINPRFAWLTAAAVVGFLLVGLSYRQGRDDDGKEAHPSQWVHDHSCPDHAGHHHTGHDHSHPIGWATLLLVALPILLGLLVPPQPLGAAALATRELNTGGLDSVMPAAVRRAAEKGAAERNVLDWAIAFRAAQSDMAQFDGLEAELISFVYRAPDQPQETFWATRFVVGCCVADAAPTALLVRWPESDELAASAWVRVRGRFTTAAGQELPVLVAESVESIPAPSQPYLYP